jgi:hypothetical protein
MMGLRALLTSVLAAPPQLKFRHAEAFCKTAAFHLGDRRP